MSDKLTAYKADVTIPVYGTIADAEVYLKDKADAEIRRLKRALWLARTERAQEKVDLFWYARASTELLNINGRPDRIPEPKGWWRQLKATEWLRIWQKVERKCLKKAEKLR